MELILCHLNCFHHNAHILRVCAGLSFNDISYDGLSAAIELCVYSHTEHKSAAQDGVGSCAVCTVVP